MPQQDADQPLYRGRRSPPVLRLPGSRQQALFVYICASCSDCISANTQGDMPSEVSKLGQCGGHHFQGASESMNLNWQRVKDKGVTSHGSPACCHILLLSLALKPGDRLSQESLWATTSSAGPWGDFQVESVLRETGETRKDKETLPPSSNLDEGYSIC